MRALVPLLLVLIPSSAWAQQLPAAAVLETQASAEVTDETSGVVDRMVRARLDRLGAVRTVSGVALDLGDVQLALGCTGETAECLEPVADELSVRLLVIPHLDQTDDELMLTLTLFDRQDGSLERVVRRAAGERARTDLLDAIDGQLRELFGMPPAPVEEPEARPAPEPEPMPVASSSPGAGSFIVMGVGALALAVGVGFGVAFLDADSEWQDAAPTTPMEVDAAHDAFARAETFAVTADVLFAVGGAALAGGLVWLLVEVLGGSSEAPVSLSPVLGPGLAGLSVQGSLEAR